MGPFIDDALYRVSSLPSTYLDVTMITGIFSLHPTNIFWHSFDVVWGSVGFIYSSALLLLLKPKSLQSVGSVVCLPEGVYMLSLK